MHRHQQGRGDALAPVRTRHAAAGVSESRVVLATRRAFPPEMQQQVADKRIATHGHDALRFEQRLVNQQLPFEVGFDGQRFIRIVFLGARAAVAMQLLPLRARGCVRIERLQCDAVGQP